MNSLRILRITLALPVLAACLCGGALSVAQQPPAVNTDHPTPRFMASTNPADAAACRGALLKIHDAISRFKAERGRLPDWLSDLSPRYLDPKQLVCPYVDRIGDLRSWRSGIRDDVFQDPKETSYAYEFCNREMSLWTGVKTTWAEYKRRTIERMGVLGEGAVPIVRCFAHDPILNLAFNGRIYTNATTADWEDQYPQFTHEDLHPETLFFHEPLRTTVRPFPQRAADTDARQLDLSRHYNAYLDEPWLPFPGGSDLKSLPQGSQPFGGVLFDVRGLIQLNGTRLLAPYPIVVSGISVHRVCSKIHFLHATRPIPVHGPKTIEDGTKVAGHVVRYESGAQVEIPIVYGRGVKDWWYDPDVPDHEPATVVWEGENLGSIVERRKIRLFLTSWQNPWKDQPVESLSLVSAMAESAPFVIAITVE